MADDRTIIFKLQLDNKSLIASSKEAETELAKLQPQLKKVAEESGKNSVEYRKLEAQVQKYTKQLKDSASALAINEELGGKDNLSTIERARAKKALTTAYNSLTEEERRNSEMGKKLEAQLKEVNEAFIEQGLAISDGHPSVGLYQRAIEQARVSMGGLQKEATLIGYAMTQNKKKLDDNTKALADMKAKGIDPTDKAYKKVADDVEFYTDALVQNKKTLTEVERELIDQTTALEQTEKEAAKIGFVYGQQEEATKSLKTQLKELKAELAKELPGTESFQRLTEQAAELQDKMKDVNEAVSAQASGSVFEKLSNQTGLLVGDLQNLDFEGVAEKARGFQAIASQISMMEMIGGLKNAGSALLSLGKAILTSPIGWLLGAGALLFAFWDDISEAIFETDHAQEALNATMEDFRKGSADASKKVMEVESAFKSARKGVISKEQALKTYNDTLGDAMGSATDLNEAEKIFTEKTAAYIQAAGLRAQANALFAKAAEEQAKGATAQFEDQTSFWFKAKIAAQNYFSTGALYKQSLQELAKEQAKGAKAEKARAAERADAISKEAQKLMELAETTENAAGIQSEAEKALAEEQKAAAKERADNAKASAEARAEAEKNAIDRIRELIISGEQLTNELAQKELDARVNARKRFAEIEEKDAVKLAERLLAIEEDRIAEQRVLNANEQADAIAELRSNAEEEIKAIEGNATQRAEQEKLIRAQLQASIDALNIEFGNKDIELTASIEQSKQAVKDAQLQKEQARSNERILVLEAELVRQETALREAGKTEEEIAQATAAKRLEILQAQNDAIQNDEAKSAGEKLKAQADYEAQLFAIKKQGLDKDVEATKVTEDQKKAIRQQALETGLQLIQEFFAIEQQNLTKRLSDVTESNLIEQESLANKLDTGLISQEKYNAELKKLEIDKAREEAKIKKEQFQKQKAADLISAGAGIAKAVIAGYATQPFFPVGVAMGTLAAGLGAVQLAKIASAQAPAFADGGHVGAVLSGKRIGPRDGMPIFRANGDNLLATVKTNEVILNEDQQRRAGGANFFRRIGVPGFASGGSTSARISANAEQSAQNNELLLQAFSSMKMSVDVKDIIRETGRRIEVEDNGNLF
jgi:hypothetical protein